MDFTGLFAAIEGIRTVLGIAKSALDAATQIKLQGFISDFYEQINTLQGKVFDLHKEKDELARKNRELEAQLTKLVAWEKTACNYRLKALADGIFVYVFSPKKARPSDEPPHYICPCCFEKQQRSILQRPSADNTNYVCRQCGLDVRPQSAPSPVFGGERRNLSRMFPL